MQGCCGCSDSQHAHNELVAAVAMALGQARLLLWPCIAFNVWHFARPGEIDELAGVKGGAVLRGVSFLVVFWVFVLSRGGAHGAEGGSSDVGEKKKLR